MLFYHGSSIFRNVYSGVRVALTSRPIRKTQEMIDSSFKFAGIAGAMAMAISASVVAQDAVQWRVEDGGNGHLL